MTRTLLMSARYTPDSIALWRAAVRRGWSAQRLHGWRAPAELRGAGVTVYGEPLFAAAVASQLDLALLEPPPGWLATLPRKLTVRKVRLTTFSEACRLTGPAFVKPPLDKSFPARVFASGAELVWSRAWSRRALFSSQRW